MSQDPFPKQELESLWCPWRVEYYQAEHNSGTNFFEEAANTTDDSRFLVVCRRKNGFLMMNKYPYTCGHLMAVTYRQVRDLQDLTGGEILEIWQLCILGQKLLRECVKAQGFNIGWNIGKAGGAGFAEHLHLHIVPRWLGDSNFMPVIAGTRILPEALMPLYERLKAALETMDDTAV